MPIRTYGTPTTEVVTKRPAFDLGEVLSSVAAGMEIGEKIRKRRLEEQTKSRDELTRLTLAGISLKDILATEEGKKLYAKAFGLNPGVFKELYEKYGENVLYHLEKFGGVSGVVTRPTGEVPAGVGLSPQEQRLAYMLSLGRSLVTPLPYYPELKVPTEMLATEPSIARAYIGAVPTKEYAAALGLPETGVIKPSDIARFRQLELLESLKPLEYPVVSDELINAVASRGTIAGLLAKAILEPFKGQKIHESLLREIIENAFNIEKEFVSKGVGIEKSLLDILLRKALNIVETYGYVPGISNQMINQLVEVYKKITGGEYEIPGDIKGYMKQIEKKTPSKLPEQGKTTETVEDDDTDKGKIVDEEVLKVKKENK